MSTLQNYTDTKCELEVAKNRLRWLLDKKEELYTKYFSITSNPKDVCVNSSHIDNDIMARYVHELHEIDVGTGKSLAEEINEQQKKVFKLDSYINIMNEILVKMSGIEYQLFYEIVMNGNTISKAVDKVAEVNNTDVRTVWRKYKNIKRYIKKISKMSVNCQ